MEKVDQEGLKDKPKLWLSMANRTSEHDKSLKLQDTCLLLLHLFPTRIVLGARQMSYEYVMDEMKTL